MDKNNSVQGLLGASMEKIKEMVDANTVIGTPINAADGTILIPVSRISYGFASGGSDLPNKANAELFGGDIGLDSVDSLEIISGIDELFGVDMTGADREHFQTINALASYVEEHVEQ